MHEKNKDAVHYHTENNYSNSACSLDPKAPRLARTCLVQRAGTTGSLASNPDETTPPACELTAAGAGDRVNFVS